VIMGRAAYCVGSGDKIWGRTHQPIELLTRSCFTSSSLGGYDEQSLLADGAAIAEASAILSKEPRARSCG